MEVLIRILVIIMAINISSYLQMSLCKLDLITNNNKRFPVIATAVSLLLFSTYKLTRNINQIKGIKEIPEHSSGYPYIGHLFSLGELPGVTIAKWHEELGPIIRIRMGVQNWISISDPILAHKIFVQHGNTTSCRPYGTYSYKHYSDHGKGVVFSNPGEGFKENRAALVSILSAQQLEKHHSLLEKEATDLVNRLIEDTAHYGSTDPKNILRLSMFNIILSLSVGKRFETIEDPEFAKLNELMHEGITLLLPKYDIAGLIPALYFIDYILGHEKSMKNNVKESRKLVHQLIEEGLNKKEPNFVKSLQKNYPEMGKMETMVILNDILAAGTDTIGVALIWIIAVMCNYQKEQFKVREELDRFIHKYKRLPRFDERKETPYSYCVIREVFRYRGQVAVGLPHLTREEIVVDGHVIPAGSTLVYNAYYMHFNPELYDEPEKFMPERFMEYTTSMSAAANGKVSGRDHYSFGWGRRICPGVHLADMQIYNAFVRILSSCIIEPDGKEPDINSMIDVSLMLVPTPFKVKFTRRTN